MSENNMNDYLAASFDGMRSIAKMETVIGQPISTPSGVTVIPVSKITMGLASGGVDLNKGKFSSPQNSGAGGGTGMSITPLGFLAVFPDATVRLVPIADSRDSIDRVASLIEHGPEIIEKYKSSLT